jgi:hypothetical protein
MTDYDVSAINEDMVLSVLDIRDMGINRSWSGFINENKITLFETNANDVTFVTDLGPPWGRLATVSFDLVENGVENHYQINACLRSWAGDRLDVSGELTGP